MEEGEGGWLGECRVEEDAEEDVDGFLGPVLDHFGDEELRPAVRDAEDAAEFVVPEDRVVRPPASDDPNRAKWGEKIDNCFSAFLPSEWNRKDDVG